MYKNMESTMFKIEYLEPVIETEIIRHGTMCYVTIMLYF